MAKPPEIFQWEYKLVTMGNPLEPDVELRANAIGKQGWELVAIDAGVWIFKRPGPKEAAAAGELEAIVEETVPVVAAPGEGLTSPTLLTSADPPLTST
jgi:hypothetical protein